VPRRGGITSPATIQGFNIPNRVVIADAVKAGDKVEIAIFGINGPISVVPPNFVFFRPGVGGISCRLTGQGASQGTAMAGPLSWRGSARRLRSQDKTKNGGGSDPALPGTRALWASARRGRGLTQPGGEP
jgi:hypothetical protein